MKHARFLIPIALGATLLHAQPAIDPGNSAQNNPLDQEITPQLDAAVKAGISYLATTQEADGSWASGRYGKNVAITALACLALMSDGHMPGRGELGDVVDRGVEFMLSSSNDSGLITSEANNGPMYGHGFATLFLGEV
ncbi:MAG TPA: prenyltransferase, partial [Phycisphaerales bacterium]|nr:prenyltransferase [Phycisphaerales bacterium]